MVQGGNWSAFLSRPFQIKIFDTRTFELESKFRLLWPMSHGNWPWVIGNDPLYQLKRHGLKRWIFWNRSWYWTFWWNPLIIFSAFTLVFNLDHHMFCQLTSYDSQLMIHSECLTFNDWSCLEYRQWQRDFAIHFCHWKNSENKIIVTCLTHVTWVIQMSHTMVDEIVFKW